MVLTLGNTIEVSWPLGPAQHAEQGDGEPQRQGRKEALVELRSGNGPLSVRVHPSSPKRDCDRRLTNEGGRCR